MFMSKKLILFHIMIYYNIIIIKILEPAIMTCNMKFLASAEKAFDPVKLMNPLSNY